MENELKTCDWCQESVDEDEIMLASCGNGTYDELCPDCYGDVVRCSVCGADQPSLNTTELNGTSVCDSSVMGNDCEDGLREDLRIKEEWGRIKWEIIKLAGQHDFDREEVEAELNANWAHKGRATSSLVSMFDGQEVYWDAYVENLLEAIGVAHRRHTETIYDSIDKSKMTEEEVAQLRRSFNSF